MVVWLMPCFVLYFCPSQVKDVLFEPVRKTQDAMFFINNPDDMWVPCGPKQPGAVQISMQELAAKGLGKKVCVDALKQDLLLPFLG
jgi:hypothetical protein